MYILPYYLPAFPLPCRACCLRSIFLRYCMRICIPYIRCLYLLPLYCYDLPCLKQTLPTLYLLPSPPFSTIPSLSLSYLQLSFPALFDGGAVLPRARHGGVARFLVTWDCVYCGRVARTRVRRRRHFGRRRCNSVWRVARARTLTRRRRSSSLSYHHHYLPFSRGASPSVVCRTTLIRHSPSTYHYYWCSPDLSSSTTLCRCPVLRLLFLFYHTLSRLYGDAQVAY